MNPLKSTKAPPSHTPIKQTDGKENQTTTKPVDFLGDNTPKTHRVSDPLHGRIAHLSSETTLNSSSVDFIGDVASEQLTLSSSSQNFDDTIPNSSTSSSSTSSSTDTIPPLVPNGLKLFNASRGAPRFIARPQTYQAGNVIMDRYVYVRDKRFGVEPGFEGAKIWTTKDDQLLRSEDLLRQKPRYHQVISEFIKETVKTDPVYQYLAREHGFQGDDFNDVPAEVIDSIRTSNNAHVNETIRNYANGNIEKFRKLHYIKLDYPEPISGKVSIPLERAKKTSDNFKKNSPTISRLIKERFSFLEPIGQHLHQKSREGTVREMNLSAVTEALANDIFEAWGFGGQNLRILHTSYQNGQSKLLLDGAHVQGKSGEPFSTFEGQIKHGQLIGNCLRDKDGRLYPLDPAELGRAKAMALLMGDFDKIGSEGGNLGFVVEGGQAKLKNIDPGKSLEGKPEISQDDVEAGKATKMTFNALGKTDRMTQRNLHTDLTFDQPMATIKDQAAKGYKNFTVFDDTLLSERMQGMKDVLDAWGKTQLIFNSYIEAFSGADDDPDISFQNELIETYQRLSARKEYFKEVLSERLALLALGPEKVDFLDNIEKLTSATVSSVGPAHDPVALRHLRVVPESRKEWHMVKQPDGRYLLWYNGSEDDAISARVALQGILQKDSATVDLLNTVKRRAGHVSISIADDVMLSRFMNAMTEEKIASYKNQKLMKHTPGQLDLIGRFEKLTSDTVPATRGCCSSDRQVIVPETRKCWELRQLQSGAFQLFFKGKSNAEGQAVRNLLVAYRSTSESTIDIQAPLTPNDGKKVVVNIENEAAIEELLTQISEQRIEEFKRNRAVL